MHLPTLRKQILATPAPLLYVIQKLCHSDILVVSSVHFHVTRKSDSIILRAKRKGTKKKVTHNDGEI